MGKAIRRTAAGATTDGGSDRRGAVQQPRLLLSDGGMGSRRGGAGEVVPLRTGDRIVYRCLAGFRYDAEVRAVRLDGRVDIAVDAGCADPVELTRIAFAEPAVHVPGTCTTGSRDKP